MNNKVVTNFTLLIVTLSVERVTDSLSAHDYSWTKQNGQQNFKQTVLESCIVVEIFCLSPSIPMQVKTRKTLLSQWTWTVSCLVSKFQDT
jgi:hypothetical protein